MTARSIARPVVLFILGLLAFIFLLMLVGYVGRASASTGAESDPVSLIVQLYDFMRSGRGTAATGVGLMLVTWFLRANLGRLVPWFRTMIGGYVLNFGTSLISYVGVALAADEQISIGLFGNAIGSAFVASGGWEALRDLFTKVGKPTSTMISLLVIAAIAIAPPGCSGVKVKQVGSDVVDCTKGELSQIVGIAPTLLPLIGGNSPDWKVLGAQLETAGASVATCVMAELINRWELGSATRKATISVDGRAELRELKAKFGVRVVITSAGEL